jgi:putative glycosyltransferase (TIGR04372 family)
MKRWVKKLISLTIGALPSYYQLVAITLIYAQTGRIVFLRRYALRAGTKDVDRICASLFARRYFFEVAHILLYLRSAEGVVRLFRARTPRSVTLPANKDQAFVEELYQNGMMAALQDVLHALHPTTVDATWRQELLLAIVTGASEETVTDLIWKNIWLKPQDRRPHQNLASRVSGSYVPNDLDYFAGRDGAIFDICNYLGQRMVHVGLGEFAVQTYSMALRAQERLRATRPPISNALQGHLKAWGIELDELRIAPNEWTVQIGHAGFLDFLIRMRTLGWWEGSLVILALPAFVANDPCLQLFEKFGKIIFKDRDVSGSVWDELCSLQRWYGLNFNAGYQPNGEIVSWPDASALAAQEWDAKGFGHPLREAYAEKFAVDPAVTEAFQDAKSAWKMHDGQWFVCLHMREPTFYGEDHGSGQTHRNADIDSYLAAIEYIISRGGFVVRLGSPGAPPLPDMPGLIDYARSKFKSPVMDLHLLFNCKFFIGTTSGLGNIANSFGVPMALVNCITVDGQLWHREVRFALKPILLNGGSMISQRDVTLKYRWAQFAYEPMQRLNLRPIDNTSDEILETVKEVEQLADGNRELPSLAEKELISRWRECLAFPHFYGASQPSKYFLIKHQSDFLSD